MSNLKFSPRIQRLIRQDAPEDLGKPTRLFIEAAVRTGSADDARQWLDYHLHEHAAVLYIYSVWNWYMVRYFLEHKPGATLADALTASMAPWVGTTVGLKGMPVASVVADGVNAQISVEGLPHTLHLSEVNGQYQLTLGSPAEQETRRAAWHAQIDAAIVNANLDDFNRLLDHYLDTEARPIHDIHADWAWALITVCAQEWGEESLSEMLRVTEEPWVTVRYAALADMSQEESLQLTVEGMRAHFTGPNRAGFIAITEEADRYVMSFDACGTGGRMRRGDPLVGSGSRLEAPYNFLNTEGAYDWTWQQKGVCAYCGHCAIVNQILPIENFGHPMRMTEYPINANDPCRWIIYKDPNGYPSQAYTNVGRTKGEV